MRVFVDTPAWFAAVNVKDRHHERALELLAAGLDLITSTFILSRRGVCLRGQAPFRNRRELRPACRVGSRTIEPTTMGDHEHAWHLTTRFEDQEFSLVDRTSFATTGVLDICKVNSRSTTTS